MDAGIKSLRIDRSAKQTNQSPRKTGRWILISLALVALLATAGFVYSKLNAAIEVETVRVRAATIGSSGGAGATILNATGFIVAALITGMPLATFGSHVLTGLAVRRSR